MIEYIRESGVERASAPSRPFSHPGHVLDLLRMLLDAVEADPSRRWKDSDFEKLSVDSSTARRQFQKTVWEELMRIPYGETRSYAAQAESIGKPSAYRAVANANGTNQLAIIIPCHRIINSNGALGGYGGGIKRKKWLIDHEKNNV